jgi:hypothetical protein
MARTKKIKKVLYFLLTLILVCVFGIVTIILYPQPLFANKMEYGQFKVYSNQKISDEIKPLLHSAISVVKKSELYDPAYKVDIFLSYNTFFNKIDDKILGYGATARAIDNNLVFKVAVDINKNLVYPTFHRPCKTGFTYLIVHETMHCLQTHKYGIIKFNPFHHPEMWKLEGYPEYISRQNFSDPTYDLKKEVEKFIELKSKQSDTWFATKEEGGCDVPEVYYKSRLMTEYLIDILHLSYDQVLKDTRSEEEIYAEMTVWANN